MLQVIYERKDAGVTDTRIFMTDKEFTDWKNSMNDLAKEFEKSTYEIIAIKTIYINE